MRELQPWENDSVSGTVNPDIGYELSVKPNSEHGYWWWSAAVGLRDPETQGLIEDQTRRARGWAQERETCVKRATEAAKHLVEVSVLENKVR